MRQKIREYQKLSEALEPDESVRKELLDPVIAYTEEFLNDLFGSNAYHTPKSDYPSSLGIGSSCNMKESIDVLAEFVDHNGINPASGGHLGYIPGGGIFASALGDYLAAITNRYSGLKFANPGAVKIEHELVDWSKKVVGYPDSALGNLTSGGSIANLIAITTARDHHKIEKERIEKSVIYLTQQTHHCVQKALNIAGLKNCHLRYVRVDTSFKMSLEDLSYCIDNDKSDGLIPFMVVGSCGSTDTGAIDPLEEISTICKKNNLWFHVDAAYGGYFALCGEFRSKLKGLENSDSMVMDPHKTLFLPYGSGIVLIRDGKSLYNSFHYSANYLQDAGISYDNISPADLSPELTKHFRGLRMWIPLKLYGEKVFSSALYEKHLLTQYFYTEVQKLGFEVGPEPELSVCIYRYNATNQDLNQFNASLVKAIQEDGRIFVSSTTINDEFWIRTAIVCFRTHIETIDLYLEILQAKTSLLESRFD